jgi:amidase
MEFLLSLVLAVLSPAQTDLSGAWALTVVDFGRPNTTRMSLKQAGDTLSGTLGNNQKLEGTITGSEISFKFGSRTAKGRFADGRLSGEVTQGDRTLEWTAVRIPPRPATPRTYTFEPTKFELYFTSRVAPVLHIAPGDTVKTWSVGADGVDPKGERRSPGGNPQTGPFYVDGAMPGDTLVVRVNRLRTNRDWAVSGSTVMSNAVEPSHLSNLKWSQDFNTRWRIDAAANVARLEQPPEHLKDFTIPLRPMLGCIAVAPGQEWAIRTTDSGRFGGNMDYNQLVEETTIYLPVNHPGALLFVGDGHAAQGDGELTGDALETSMEHRVHRRRDRGQELRPPAGGERRLSDQHRHRQHPRPGAADGHLRDAALAGARLQAGGVRGRDRGRLRDEVRRRRSRRHAGEHRREAAEDGAGAAAQGLVTPIAETPTTRLTTTLPPGRLAIWTAAVLFTAARRELGAHRGPVSRRLLRGSASDCHGSTWSSRTHRPRGTPFRAMGTSNWWMESSGRGAGRITR